MGFHRAAFQMPRRQGGTGGSAPEMPDAVRVLADAENYGGEFLGIRERDGIVGVSGEPGVTRVEASADVGVVIVEDYVFAIHSAGKLGAGDLDLRVLVSWNASVGDGDSPQYRRCEIRRLGDGVDVAGFVPDFGRNPGVGLSEAGDAE